MGSPNARTVAIKSEDLSTRRDDNTNGFLFLAAEEREG